MPTQPIGQTGPQAVLTESQSTLNKDDFLRLLVTQLRNQDPLNPINSEEFAAQLAQFSSVEQLHNINANLEYGIEFDILLNQTINNTMATTLIGKSVRAVGNTAALIDGETADMHYHVASSAEKVTLKIMDSHGEIVRTVVMTGQTEGDHLYEWNGQDDAGNELPEGKYSFSVSAIDANGNSVTAETFIFGFISGVRYENGNAILRIGELEVGLADVIEIGEGKEASE